MTFTENQIDELQYSNQYADYICSNADTSCAICDGDSLLVAMETGYLFSDFLKSLTVN